MVGSGGGAVLAIAHLATTGGGKARSAVTPTTAPGERFTHAVSLLTRKGRSRPRAIHALVASFAFRRPARGWRGALTARPRGGPGGRRSLRLTEASVRAGVASVRVEPGTLLDHLPDLFP